MWRKLLIVGFIAAVSSVASAQTATNTATSTATITNTPTRTSTGTRTITPTRTPLSEDTVTATRTSTRTPTASFTAASTSTITRTPASTGTVAPTATITPVEQLVSYPNAGCIVLSATPQALGGGTRRKGLSFWSFGGEMWCGYQFSLVSRTPGAHSGAHYTDGQGLNKCACQDATVYCIGDNTVQACFDECADATPSVTATATATPTP